MNENPVATAQHPCQAQLGTIHVHQSANNAYHSQAARSSHYEVVASLSNGDFDLHMGRGIRLIVMTAAAIGSGW